MIPLEWIYSASSRIRETVIVTPITHDVKRDWWFKWENHQVTGSFKVRGAVNKIFSLEKWEQQQGIVTCSAGNHGQGVALACSKISASCLVFASSHAVQTKIDAIKKLGGIVKLVDGGYSEAEKAAREHASKTGMVFVSPYNDIQVIAGQGTIGLELANQTNQFAEINSIIVPVGGGGLISGIGAAISGLGKKPKLIGVQSIASAYFHSLFYNGTQEGIIESESIADGLAGEVEEGSITIPLVKKYVDDIVLVTEVEIKNAIRHSSTEYNEQIEGSAAVTLAALLQNKINLLPSLMIISGGNIQPLTFDSIVKDSSFTS